MQRVINARFALVCRDWSLMLWSGFCGVALKSNFSADSDAAKLQHSYCSGSVFGIPETNVSSPNGGSRLIFRNRSVPGRMLLPEAESKHVYTFLKIVIFRRTYYAHMDRHGCVLHTPRGNETLGDGRDALRWLGHDRHCRRFRSTDWRRRRSFPETPGPVASQLLQWRYRWPQTAADRHRRLPVRAGLWHDDLHAAQKPARVPGHARNFGTHLRDLQDLSGDTGKIHSVSVGFHRGHHRSLLRLAVAGAWKIGRADAADYSCVQSGGNRGELWRGVVRHSRKHVRQLADSVRFPAGQAVSGVS